MAIPITDNRGSPSKSKALAITRSVNPMIAQSGDSVDGAAVSKSNPPTEKGCTPTLILPSHLKNPAEAAKGNVSTTPAAASNGWLSAIHSESRANFVITLSGPCKRFVSYCFRGISNQENKRTFDKRDL